MLVSTRRLSCILRQCTIYCVKRVRRWRGWLRQSIQYTHGEGWVRAHYFGFSLGLGRSNVREREGAATAAIVNLPGRPNCVAGEVRIITANTTSPPVLRYVDTKGSIFDYSVVVHHPTFSPLTCSVLRSGNSSSIPYVVQLFLGTLPTQSNNLRP